MQFILSVFLFYFLGTLAKAENCFEQFNTSTPEFQITSKVKEMIASSEEISNE